VIAESQDQLGERGRKLFYFRQNRFVQSEKGKKKRIPEGTRFLDCKNNNFNNLQIRP
jgi:hypothetical protein